MADYKIALADEHELFLEGVKNLLEASTYPGYSVSATAKSGKDLISIVESENFDAVIFEINFVDIEPEELIEKLRRIDKNVKLFVLSAYGDMNLVKTCFRLGVDGYLLKTSDSNSLIEGLNRVFMDEIFIGENLKVAPERGNGIKEEVILKKKELPIDRFLIRQKLTKREKEILNHIFQGMTNKTIAKELFISEHTVGVHRKHVMKKLNVTSTTDLIDFVEEFQILINDEKAIEN